MITHVLVQCCEKCGWPPLNDRERKQCVKCGHQFVWMRPNDDAEFKPTPRGRSRWPVEPLR